MVASRLILLSALLAGSMSAAQTTVIPPVLSVRDSLNPTSVTIGFNASACADTSTMLWNAGGSGNSPLVGVICSPLTLWVTTGECGDTFALTDKRYSDIPQATVAGTTKTGAFQVKLSELPGFSTADGGVICGTEGVESTTRLCGALSYSNSLDCNFGTKAILRADPLTIIYDTKAPTAPSLDAIVEKDTGLQVDFTATDDTLLVEFEVRAQGQTDFTFSREADGTGTSVRLTDLTNGTTYDVRAYAVDAAGNRSGFSEVLSGTPKQVDGFWATFRGSGGTEQGCSSVPGGFVVVGLAIAALMRKQRRNGQHS